MSPPPVTPAPLNYDIQFGPLHPQSTPTVPGPAGKVTWNQSTDEVFIQVPVASGVKGRDVKLEASEACGCGCSRLEMEGGSYIL